MLLIKWVLAGIAVLLVGSCTTVHVQRPPLGLDHQASWALLPVVNHTQTPQAGLRAESILETLVRARGVANLQKYPTELNSESLFEPAERAAVDRGLQWARNLEADYALTGTVDEWRYKVGVDGEPAVGISLQLIEMRTGRVLWTAVGSKTGWSREALSAVAQKLLARLTQPLAMRAAQQPAGTAPGRAAPVPGSTPRAQQAPVRRVIGSGAGQPMRLPAPRVTRRPSPTPDKGSQPDNVQTKPRAPYPLRDRDASKSGV